MGDQRAIGTEGMMRIAARQYGVVTGAQLRALGVDKSGVHRRVRSGALYRVQPGVFAVGRPGLSRHGRWIAAVLSLGEAAVLSHRSAAELWALLPAQAGSGPIHVAVPDTGGRRQRPGLVIHRFRCLGAVEKTKRQGIPVTSVARTIADLERTSGPELVRRARRQAEYLGFDFDTGRDDHTASELEALVLRLCASHGIASPEVNVPLGSFVVDFLWRSERFVLEADGYRAQGGATAFESDRRRDTALATLGYEVRRVTWDQVANNPASAAAMLRARLGIGA